MFPWKVKNLVFVKVEKIAQFLLQFEIIKGMNSMLFNIYARRVKNNVVKYNLDPIFNLNTDALKTVLLLA